MSVSRSLFAVVLLGVVAYLPSASLGDITLSLAPSPVVDLGNLSVGQTVGFEVLLSNVAESPTGNLSMLNGTVQWPGANFSVLTGPDAGPIVPVPAAFVPTASPGLVDGFYFDGGGFPIASDGVFFTFSLTAATAGSGAIGLSDIVALDSSFAPILDVAVGPPLPFSITAAVPEPGSLVLFAFGSAVLGLAGVGRRRKLYACLLRTPSCDCQLDKVPVEVPR